MTISLSRLALALAVAAPAWAQKAGSFTSGGDSKISAMMMFLGNDEMVYIMDKAEGNAAQIDGHPAWGAVWDIATHEVALQDIRTNVFCASGMHLPNGSFATFGGNAAVTVGGNLGSVLNDGGFSASYDATYQDYDGTKAIRILNPCPAGSDFGSTECGWFDDPAVLSMKKQRWYSTAEPLGTGQLVIIGGFVQGGYVNRNWPNVDPEFEGGAADCTYEFFPNPDNTDAQTMQFMIDTSGLNSYAHTFLLPSGLMFLQANLSSTLWDPATNAETRLPDMPGGVARVYPASGGVAMLPLTPENNYTPTILFCGGTDMPDYAWGNYSWPFIDTFNYPASKDCQRITPQPEDGSSGAYEQDEDMLEGRTMGQFIILPTGKLLMVNGGQNGTAGYSEKTLETQSYADMPWGMSLASDPAFTPAIYDPKAEMGSRWSNEGLDASTIPRLYHSSALLLPDASVIIAGSNPNVDVNLTTVYPTTYDIEIFYPPYYSASVRPKFTGAPDTLSYGGDYFDLTISKDSYSGKSNDAAATATCVVVRPGWTTHGMNMGQKFLQLNNTYTVNDDGSIVLHCSQMPPNSNVFQPGPALLFVNVNDIPSNGTHVIVGSGNIEAQPTSDVKALPSNVLSSSASGGADSSSTGSGSGSNDDSDSSTSNKAVIASGVIGALVVIALIGALFGLRASRRRRAAAHNRTDMMREVPGGGAAAKDFSDLHSADSLSVQAYNRAYDQSHDLDRYRSMWNESEASLGGANESKAGGGFSHPYAADARVVGC